MTLLYVYGLRDRPTVRQWQEWNGLTRRVERLKRQMREDCGVLAAGKEKHRPVGLGSAIAQDLDGFSLKPVEMRQVAHAATS